MGRFFKTNDGLGYRQYTYVLKLNKNEYLICYAPENTFYSTGSVEDFSEYNLETVDEKQFRSTSHISKSLIDYLIRDSNERVV